MKQIILFFIEKTFNNFFHLFTYDRVFYFFKFNLITDFVPILKVFYPTSIKDANIWHLLIVFSSILIVYIFYFFKKKINKELESKINQLEEANLLLNNSLKHQEVLIKEIHHRVKNNLQIVMSLLDIQSKNTNQENLQTFIENSRSRISAMALIHQNLYLSNSATCISFQEYLEELTQSIKTCFDKKHILINISTKGIILNLNIAVQLGLIVNELVCNSIKHGFILNENDNEINISMSKNNRDFLLIVSDNGVGIKKNNVKKSKSIGLELVELLVIQLRGKIITRNIKNGTQYLIEFKD